MASKKQAPKKDAPAKKAPAKKAVAKAPAKKAAAPTPKPSSEPSLSDAGKQKRMQEFVDKGFTPDEIKRYSVEFMRNAVRNTRQPYDWIDKRGWRGGV